MTGRERTIRNIEKYGGDEETVGIVIGVIMLVLAFIGFLIGIAYPWFMGWPQGGSW